MKTVTLFNHAGGAGKSSITLNAGYELARSGLRVLLIDLDPQANLTTWLGVEDAELEETVHPVATEGRPLSPPRQVHGLHLIPSRVDVALAEVLRLPGRENAGDWVAKARRYVAARRALDTIETAALVEPRTQPPAPGRAPRSQASR